MTPTSYFFTIISLLTFQTFITRAAPFLFRKQLEHNKTFQAIGKQLPSYLMLLMMFHSLEKVEPTQYPYAIPEIIALLVITALHLWKRNLCISTVGGTLLYILLLLIVP